MTSASTASAVVCIWFQLPFWPSIFRTVMSRIVSRILAKRWKLWRIWKSEVRISTEFASSTLHSQAGCRRFAASQAVVEKFDHEKRILFTRPESQAIDRLVVSLATRLNSQAKVSHVVRALVERERVLKARQRYLGEIGPWR